MTYRIALALLQAVISLTAAAEQPTFVTVVADNDWFAHEDRHYTGGSHIAFARDIDSLPESIRALAPFRWSADRTAVFSVGQRIYTPGNTNPKPDEPADRPFAGWVYFQADLRTRSGPVSDHLTGTIGFIGPAAGGEHVQKIAHHLLSSREIPGWDTQLRGEPTLSVAYERSWPSLLAHSLHGLSVDLSPYAGATLGTPYTYANTGVIARIGRNLPDDLATTVISLGTPRDGYRGTNGFGWYAWAGVDARVVGRNVFLDGSTFRDSPSVDRKPWQHDVAVGVVIAWPRTRVGFTLLQRSPEFEGQRGSDRFGQLAVSFVY